MPFPQPRLGNETTAAPSYAGLQIVMSYYNATGASIAAGSWVQLDRSVTTYGVGTAMKLAVDAGISAKEVLGVVMDAVPDLTFGRVCVYGPITGASAHTDLDAGDLLTIHTTDGMCADQDAVSDSLCVGSALTADSSGTATVFVRCLGAMAQGTG